MTNGRVIISTSNTLEAIGLRDVLNTVFGIAAHIAGNDFFINFSQATEPDLFFIDIDTLMANLSFFLPRKNKTIVVTRGNKDVEDIQTLNIKASENDIINRLNHILEVAKKDEKSNEALSSREIEVLRLIASGKINKEIALELDISINTVLTHRKNITSKLGIKSVSGLTFYAMMNGII